MKPSLCFFLNKPFLVKHDKYDQIHEHLKLGHRGVDITIPESDHFS